MHLQESEQHDFNSKISFCDGAIIANNSNAFNNSSSYFLCYSSRTAPTAKPNNNLSKSSSAFLAYIFDLKNINRIKLLCHKLNKK